VIGMESAQATSKAAVAGRRILGYLLLALLLPAVLLSGQVVVLCEDVNRWLGAGVGVQR